MQADGRIKAAASGKGVKSFRYEVEEAKQGSAENLELCYEIMIRRVARLDLDAFSARLRLLVPVPVISSNHLMRN